MVTHEQLILFLLFIYDTLKFASFFLKNPYRSHLWMYVRRFDRICWVLRPWGCLIGPSSCSRAQICAGILSAVAAQSFLRWNISLIKVRQMGRGAEKQAVMSTTGLLRVNVGSRWSDGGVTWHSCTTAVSPTVARNTEHLVEGGQEASNKHTEKSTCYFRGGENMSRICWTAFTRSCTAVLLCFTWHLLRPLQPFQSRSLLRDHHHLRPADPTQNIKAACPCADDGMVWRGCQRCFPVLV